MQFSLRSLFVFTAIAAGTVWFAIESQKARQAARNAQCSNKLRQHSGFHGPQCDWCKEGMVSAITSDEWPPESRVHYIQMVGKSGWNDRDLLEAVQVASNDENPNVRTTALGVLTLVKSEYSLPRDDD